MYRIIELLSSNSGSAVITTRGFFPDGVSRYLYWLAAVPCGGVACPSDEARGRAKLIAITPAAETSILTVPPNRESPKCVGETSHACLCTIILRWCCDN